MGPQGATGATGPQGATGATGPRGVVTAQAPLALDAAGKLTVGTATATDPGVLSAQDWTTFNGKVSPTDPRLTDARAPTQGSSFYIQNYVASGTAQQASFGISGSGSLGGNLAVGGGISAAGYAAATDFIPSARAGLVVDLYESLWPFQPSSLSWTPLANGRVAMSFNGTSDYAALANSNEYMRFYESGVGLSVAAWVNTTSGGPVLTYYICGNDFLALNVASVTAGGTAYGVYDNNSSRPYVSTTSTIANGQWHLLVFTHSDATKTDRIYLDGVKEGDNAGTGVSGPMSSLTSPPAGFAMYIGSMLNCSKVRSSFSGQIDGVRVWQRPLAPGEVAALYAATRPLYP